MNPHGQTDERRPIGDRPNIAERLKAVLRFGVVGILQNGLSLLLILAVLRVGFEPWQAFALTFPISVTVTYWLNSRWSFAGRSRPGTAPVAYASVYVVAYFLAICVSYGLQRLGLWEWLNATVTIVTIGGFTFVALDRSVFGRLATRDHG